MDDVKIGEILLPGDEDTQQRRDRTVRAGFWPKIKKVMRHIPFSRDAVAAFYCATDRHTPLRVRGVLLAALGYFILPVDAVPDMFAIIGFTDDLAVLTAALALVRGNLNENHYRAADMALADEQNPPAAA